MLSFGVHREGLWNCCMVVVCVAVGFGARHLSDPLFGPDYNEIQRYFTAHNDGDAGEHVVEILRAKDAGLKLALRTVYHDRAEDKIATAQINVPKETQR